MNFPIEKSILGRKLTAGKVAFQSSFTYEAEDTLNFFNLRAANIYVTVKNSRLFAYRINSSKGLSE